MEAGLDVPAVAHGWAVRGWGGGTFWGPPGQLGSGSFCLSSPHLFGVF